MGKSHNPFVRLILLTLLTVTGYMTWSSLTTIMGGAGMALVISAVALVAYEGNLIMGPILHRNAGSEKQKSFATLLTVIGVVGISLGAIMEVILNNTDAAVIMAYVRPILPYAVISIIIATVSLYVAYDWADPEHELERAKRDADNAEAYADLLYQQAQAAAIRKAAQSAAPDVATNYADGVVGKLNQRYRGNGVNGATSGTGGDTDPLPPAVPGSPSSTRRGKSTQQSAR